MVFTATRGPVSLVGGSVHKGEKGDATGLQNLVVVEKEKFLDLPGDGELIADGCAYVSVSQPTPGLDEQLVQLENGSDCSLQLRTVAATASLPVGCVVVDALQRMNLRLCPAATVAFERMATPEELVDVEIDVIGPISGFDLSLLRRRAPRAGDAGDEDDGEEDEEEEEEEEEDEEGEGDGEAADSAAEDAVFDAEGVTAAFLKAFFQRAVSVMEDCAVVVGGVPLMLRVLSVNNKTETERAEDVVYHCHRGLVSGLTAVVYAEAAKAAGRVAGKTCVTRSERPPGVHDMRVDCSDGEHYVVKRRLLRPCIALTPSLRDEACAALSVAVDCLLFDRVLLFLEAEAMGKVEKYNLDISMAQQLVEAASTLGCRSLEDAARSKMGDWTGRLREYRYDEVVAANAAGSVWILVDGMVLDVTRWLPEHPGGSKIIPKQGLNKDASRFFEVYHSSRESFTYLQHFYIGELNEEEKAELPKAGGQEPTPGFIQEVARYTSDFRMTKSGSGTSYATGAVHKSF